WKLGFRMGHDLVNRDIEHLSEFVKKQNAQGRSVVATVSNSLAHFPMPNRIAELPTNGFKPKVSLLERALLRTSYAEEISAGGGQRVLDDAARLQTFN